MVRDQRTHRSRITIVRRTLAISLFGLICLVIVWPRIGTAMEYRLQPYITVSEEYNDNIFLTPTGKVDDYLTRIMPAFLLDYRTSFWRWNVDFQYDYRYYLNRTVTEDSTYRANVLGHSEVINNLFYVDLSDTYQRQSLNLAQNYAQYSLFLNQSDQNIFTVNPYFVQGLGTSNKASLGYKYVNTWYKSSSGISTVDNIGYVVIASSVTSKMTFSTGVQYDRNFNKLNDYYMTDVFTGPTYSYAPHSYAFGVLGWTWLEFQGYGEVQHLIWDVGFEHRYSTMTLRVETKTAAVPDPTLVLRRVDQLEITLTKISTERTAISGKAGWYEYRNIATDHLEQDSYILSGTAHHALTPILTLSGELDTQRLHDFLLAANTYIFEIGLSLERRLLSDLIGTVNYWYTNSYSPDIYLNNFKNNRISVELTKHF